MSEQPTNNIYNMQEHRRLKADGSLEMGVETDVSFHESELPPKPASPVFDTQPAKMLTEQELMIIRIKGMATELKNLNIVRNDVLGINHTTRNAINTHNENEVYRESA